MESVLAHEYGHHIANNRINTPWNAGNYGPKRWASYMNICERVEAGTAFPGDEGAHYTLNPGEAWAESYRQMVWSSRTWASWPQEPWAVVDQSFYPDSVALGLARQDVLSPWSQFQVDQQPKTITGRLPKRQRTVTVRVAAPNDGYLSIELFSPDDGRFTLIDGESGAIVEKATVTASHTICGTRSFRIKITGPAGKRYRIEVHTP
jgi:hypothetical protein